MEKRTCPDLPERGCRIAVGWDPDLVFRLARTNQGHKEGIGRRMATIGEAVRKSGGRCESKGGRGRSLLPSRKLSPASLCTPRNTHRYSSISQIGA